MTSYIVQFGRIFNIIIIKCFILKKLNRISIIAKLPYNVPRKKQLFQNLAGYYDDFECIILLFSILKLARLSAY